MSEDLVDIDARRLIDKVEGLTHGVLGDRPKRTVRGAAPAAPTELPAVETLSLYE